MPIELVLIIWVIVARLVLWGIERICMHCTDKLWKASLCMFFAVMTGVPFFLLLKDGWFEKLGLEETDSAFIILVLIVIYWVFSISRFLIRLQSSQDTK